MHRPAPGVLHRLGRTIPRCSEGPSRKRRRRCTSEAKEKVYVEPMRVRWYKDHGISRPRDIGRVRPTASNAARTEGDAPTASELSDASPFASRGGVYSKAYEAQTLQRLRDAARQSQAQAAQ
ncbi:hypothetical protein L1887_40471 [Cichorium endivia]|nr:hypothetical protein L1887_40471 [Cichorium endivia]